MTVYLVGAGPGDPGLLTVRGAELLARADVVLYDRLAAAALVELAPPTAERIGVGKTPGHPSTPQDEINRLLVEKGRAGLTVVRLKGGDPYVFGRGGEEAQALKAAGVPFEVVPGVSALSAVPAYAGIPVTHRGLSKAVTVVTGQGDPWSAPETDWEALARVGGTLVLYMAAAVRGEIAARLMAGGMDPSTPVAAITNGTRAEQTTIRTTLAELAIAPVEPPATIVIGAVAELSLHGSLAGKRIVVTAPGSLAARLIRRGATVVRAETIAIAGAADGGAALRAAHARAGEYDWMVFTSANGVERFCADPPVPGTEGSAQKVAVVGPATADAARAYGLHPALVPERADADALVDLFPSGPGRVLVPQAAGARPTLVDGLRAKGWDVDAVEAYRTVAVGLSDAQRTAAAGADAIAFTSSSTVTNYLDAGGPVPAAVVCIGAVTAEAAHQRGLHVNAIADPQTVDGVVAALAALW